MLAAVVLVTSEPRAADPKPAKIDKRLKEVERQLQQGKAKSRALKREADQLRRRLEKTREERIYAAQRVQALESRTSEIGREIVDLDGARQEKELLLKTRRAQFSQVLAALQRLSQVPPEALIARPEPPSELVRSAILLRSTVPQIEAQAARLREDLIALAETRKLLAARKLDLGTTSQELAKERRRLDGILARTQNQRRDALAASQVETARLRTLAREANSLRELFQGILRTRKPRISRKKPLISKPKAKSTIALRRPLSPPATALPPITKRRGQLPLPAIGRIVGRYGETTGTGLTRKGIAVATRAGARVIAPHHGTVVFAGAFRGYGQLLIIAHGEGYHSLMAGMSRIDGILGQSLRAGEPVGIMGGSNLERPKLYIELRRGGQPVNPVPWLKTSKGKASG